MSIMRRMRSLFSFLLGALVTACVSFAVGGHLLAQERAKQAAASLIGQVAKGQLGDRVQVGAAAEMREIGLAALRAADENCRRLQELGHACADLEAPGPGL